LIVDYHMHLRAPDESIEHSLDAVERYVEVAQARGIDQIGFSEHVYYFEETRALWTTPYHRERCLYRLEPYVNAIVEAKRRGMPVKLGLEVDYEPDKEEETHDILAPYPWDFLIGSIHFIDGRGIDGEPSLVSAVGVEAAWRRYYDTLGRAARSGLFDTLAHPDLVKMFGPEIPWDWSAVAAQLDGVRLEVSSAGLHKPHGMLYPNAELLSAAKASGVEITLASDAHVPQNVGRDLDSAIEHARAGGYDMVTVFERRVPRQVPLG
jgi:histidinol-phosphatase (PHP family)